MTDLTPFTSGERFIDFDTPTTDHDAHCRMYYRVCALGAYRMQRWMAYEYYRVKAGDNLHDNPVIDE